MEPTNETIPVHNAGFVRLMDHMGSDLTVVNAARVSFGKRKESFDAKDAELLQYLSSHGHFAPFRHCHLTFHVKAPIFVMRQWMKHRIASDFNEISGRYVDLSEAEFFVPDVFREAAANVKQGSGGDLDPDVRDISREVYEFATKHALEKYNRLVNLGVCREQARAVLPLALYSEVYWTASLEAVAHFLHLRLDSHAQKEIQDYAAAVRDLVLPLFPESLKALMKCGKVHVE